MDSLLKTSNTDETNDDEGMGYLQNDDHNDDGENDEVPCHSTRTESAHWQPSDRIPILFS